MGSLGNPVVHDAREYAASERESVLQGTKPLSAPPQTQRSHVCGVKIESEKVEGVRAKDRLIQHISGLLGELTSAVDHNLCEIIYSDHVDNARMGAGTPWFGTKYGDGMLKV